MNLATPFPHSPLRRFNRAPFFARCSFLRAAPSPAALAFAALLASLPALTACGGDDDDAAAKDDRGFRIITLEPVEIREPIDVLGTVSYIRKAEVASKILNRVEELYAEEGDRVEQNARLAKIETLELEIQLKKDRTSLEVQDRQIGLAKARLIEAEREAVKRLAAIETAKADVREAKANYANLQRTIENKQKLFEIGAVSESEMKNLETSMVAQETALFKAEKNLENIRIGFRAEDLRDAGMEVPGDPAALRKALIRLNTVIERAEYEMAVANKKTILANIESTQLLLREAVIRSPIPGIVATRAIEMGEKPKEGEPLFVIVDASPVLIQFNVNEGDLWRLNSEMEVEFSVDALEEETFTGTIHLISPVVDPQSRTVEVKVRAENPEFRLRPGMFSRGTIIEETPRTALVMPPNSILPAEEDSAGYIFVVNDQGLLFKKKVNVGQPVGENVRIFGDVQAGDRVAVGAVRRIQEGMPADAAPGEGAGEEAGQDESQEPGRDNETAGPGTAQEEKAGEASPNANP